MFAAEWIGLGVLVVVGAAYLTCDHFREKRRYNLTVMLATLQVHFMNDEGDEGQAKKFFAIYNRCASRDGSTRNLSHREYNNVLRDIRELLLDLYCEEEIAAMQQEDATSIWSKVLSVEPH